MAVIEVANIERVVVDVLGSLMTRASMSTTPDGDGVYADLAMPFDKALRRFGVTPAVRFEPSDADIPSASDGYSDAFENAVIVETLRILRVKLLKVDQQQGQDSQKLSQYGSQIDDLLAMYEPLATTEAERGSVFGVADYGFDGPPCLVVD